MKRKALTISSSLALVASVLSALWLWRSRASEEGAPAPPSTPAAAGAPGSAEPAAPGQQPGHGAARDGAERARPQQTGPTPQQEPIPRKPTSGLGPQKHEVAPEELERNREVVERSQKAWDEHVAPLLYPPGHPHAGTYLDTRDARPGGRGPAPLP